MSSHRCAKSLLDRSALLGLASFLAYGPLGLTGLQMGSRKARLRRRTRPVTSETYGFERPCLRHSLIQMVGLRVYLLMLCHASWYRFRKEFRRAVLVMAINQGYGCPEFHEEVMKSVQNSS
jgi:hypothetical protein